MANDFKKTAMKVIFWFLTVPAFLWCVWVTDNIYSHRTAMAEDKKASEKICEDVNEIKEALNKQVEELKKQNEKREADHKEILKLLIRIQNGRK